MDRLFAWCKYAAVCFAAKHHKNAYLQLERVFDVFAFCITWFEEYTQTRTNIHRPFTTAHISSCAQRTEERKQKGQREKGESREKRTASEEVQKGEKKLQPSEKKCSQRRNNHILRYVNSLDGYTNAQQPFDSLRSAPQQPLKRKKEKWTENKERERGPTTTKRKTKAKAEGKQEARSMHMRTSLQTIYVFTKHQTDRPKD